MDILAVVPIFVNAGAAILPTLVAAITSVLVVLFKPRELLGLIRRRPLLCGLCAGVVAVAVAAAILGLRGQRPVREGQIQTAGAAARYDWTQVALDLIAQGQVRQASAAAPAPAAPPRPQGEPVAAAPAPDTQDFSRCFYTGGPSPVGLRPLWSFGPEETLFLGIPAVHGNRVFAAGCQTDLGGYTGLLACLDRDTGKPIWQVTEIRWEPLRPFFSSPAVTGDGKSIVIGQGLHADRDCSLLCFDAQTGQLRWAVKTTLHIESSPAISGDLAVVGAGAVEGRDGRPVGDSGFCLAVRISDGKELWRVPVVDPESSPAIDGEGVVYIGSGFNGAAVVAIRTQTDEELSAKGLERVAWRTPVAHPVTGPITLAGDVVLAGGGNSDMVHSNRNAQGLVIAMDRRTGAILWQTPFDDAVLGGVACREGVLICPVRTGEVAALALKDGSVLWRTRVSGDSPVLAGCGFTGRHVYAVSNDGYLAVLDARDGKTLEKVPLNDQSKPGTGLALSTPRIIAGRVLVGSETGGLRCLVGSEGGE